MAGLGNTTIFATPAKAYTRYALQSAAAALLPNERVGWCLHRVSGNGLADGVKVVKGDHSGHTHLKGVAVCGSYWVCPVCGSRIAARRREEISQAFKDHSDLTPIMVTCTFRHNRGMKLAESMNAMQKAWRSMRSGKGWQLIQARYGLIASVVNIEVTYGQNGWHPHKHCVFLSNLPASQVDIARFQADIYARWHNALAELGYNATEEAGVKADIGDQAVGDYLSKYGVEWELTGMTTKTGSEDESLTPNQILARYANATDPQERAFYGGLYKEYAEAMKGRHSLQWSRGARELLGLTAEKSDQELAEEITDTGETIVTIPASEWPKVWKNDAIPELLAVCEAGDRSKIGVFLDTLGIADYFFDG